MKFYRLIFQRSNLSCVMCSLLKPTGFQRFIKMDEDTVTQVINMIFAHDHSPNHGNERVKALFMKTFSLYTQKWQNAKLGVSNRNNILILLYSGHKKNPPRSKLFIFLLHKVVFMFSQARNREIKGFNASRGIVTMGDQSHLEREREKKKK